MRSLPPLRDAGLIERDDIIDKIGAQIVSVLSETEGQRMEVSELLDSVTGALGTSRDDARVALSRLTGKQVSGDMGRWVTLL